MSVYDIRQLLLGSVLHTLVIFTDQPTFATRTIGVCRARILEDPVALEANVSVIELIHSEYVRELKYYCLKILITEWFNLH